MPVLVLFVVFMLGMSFRNVAYNTLTTKVPRTGERARFMSIQSAVQHFASAAGAFVSAHMLRESADQRLQGVEGIAWVSIALTLLVPVLLWRVERQVLRPDVSASHAQPLEIHSGVNSPGPGLPRPLQKVERSG
jgi:Na+/melibiose symporter-like transporter